MSLEAAVQENTAALRELIAHLAAGGAPVAPKSVKKPETVKTEPVAAQAAAVESAGQPVDVVVVEYDDVKDAIIKLSSKKGRDAAVAVLKQFSAAKVPDLKPEDYAAVHAAASKLLAA